MDQGKYVFAKVTEFLPRRVFDRIVKSLGGNRYVKSLTCWNRMLCMLFGQLASRESMRDRIWSGFFISLTEVLWVVSEVFL